MSIRQAKNLMSSVSFFKVSFAIFGVCVLLVTSFKASLAQEVDVTLLATPGPLGDSVQGAEDAPVTLIEYFSFTCYHCANFHKEIYPQIKSAYIDKGKIRYILRDFPLDSVAMSASILARCEGSKKYPAFADLLLKTQDKWAFSPKPLETLKEQMKQAGMTSERFDACLKDENLYKGIAAVKTRAADGVGVNATPAFFINGERLPQGITFQIFQEKINSLLPPEKNESHTP
jgi:protein-disulfide isomerase